MRATSQTWNRLLKQLSLSTRRLPARLLWGLAALSLSLLVLCCLPIAQIQLAGAQAQGMMGNYGSPILIGFTLSPTSVSGGQNVTATLLLQNPAPDGGATVSLTSDNSSVATVPATVNIPAGQNSATFWLATSQVTAATTVNLSATLGSVTLSATLLVEPAAPASISLDPSRVSGTDTSIGTLTLNNPAPAGGVTVALTNSDPDAATVPASVTVAPGLTSASFLVETNDITSTTTATITGTLDNGSVSAQLTINPYAGPTDRWRMIATYSGTNAYTGTNAPGNQWQELFEDLQGNTMWPGSLPYNNVDIAQDPFINQPLSTTSGGLTAHLSSDLGFAVGLGSANGQLKLNNGQINLKLVWLPNNHDPIADPPPKTVRLYARRKVTVAAGSIADCDNSSASNEASASCDSVGNDTGPIAATGPNNYLDFNPSTAGDAGFVSRDVNVSAAGIATTSFAINWTFTASDTNASGTYCADVGGMSSADILVDICLPGFDMGRFHGPLVPFGGGKASKSSDPSFTRWLPLSFSPVVTAQTFNMANANTIVGLPAPWGNLNCNYSIRLEQEPATPNPDYEGQALEYLPGPGSDGTYNNPQAPNQVINTSSYAYAITDANGDRLQFDKDYLPAPDVKSTLTQFLATKLSPAYFVLSHAGPPGHLREIGNYTYTFQTVGPTGQPPNPALVAQLSSIGDDLGNQQTLSYAGDNNTNPFLTVTDSSSGRQLLFNRAGQLGYVTSVDAPSSTPGVINTHTTLTFSDQGYLNVANVYDGATQALLASDTFGAVDIHGLSTVSHQYENDPLVTDPFGWPILRLSSDTYGTNDSASSDDGNSIAGTYSYGYGPLSIGYNNWGQAAHTNTVTDPRGNLFSTQYLLSGDINGMTGSITGTISTGPDYTGAPTNSNVSRVTYTPDIHQPTSISVQDPLGNTWQSVLNGFGELQSVQDPSQHQWSFGYNEDGTLLTSSTDPTNLTWLFHYGETDNGQTNPASRLTSVLDPVGATRAKIDYNTFGQPITVTTPAAVAASGTNEQTQLAYDNLTGDLTKITDPLGDILTPGNYDALGDALSSTVYPDTGDPATSRTALSSGLILNGAQEVTQATLPNGVQVANTWNNGVITQIQTHAPPSAGGAPLSGALLSGMNTAYDSRGRMYQAADLIGIAAQYRYDKNSNLTQVWDGQNNITRLSYGPNNEPTGMVWPDKNTTRLRYDAAGKIVSVTDERGILSNYDYDTDGRLIDILFPAIPAQNVHTTYDATGRPLTVTDATGSRQYSYDPVLKRLTGVVTTISALPTGQNTFTVSFTYYGDGTLQSMTSPAGTTTYQYDAGGQLISLTNPFAETSTWNYDHAGRPTGQSTQTGAHIPIATSLTYGPSNLPGDSSLASAYLSEITQTVNNQVFWTYTLQHSYLGQLLQQQGTGSQAGQSSADAFAYDARGRLAADGENDRSNAQNPLNGGGSYNYDLANNLQGGTGSWSYNANNQVTSAPTTPGVAGATALTYDAAGNLTSCNGSTLSYDCWGRLSSVGNVSYTYDSAGRRASKTVNGQTTYFLYAGGSLIAEVDASGNILRSYTWGAAGLVSDRVAGQGRFYLFDALGDTRALLDANGNVLARGAYTAWGTPLSGLAAFTPYGWKGQGGQYTDSETGLVYLSARYYAPTLGRFLTRDPIGFAGGINLYVYCGGDPVNYADPGGLDGGSQMQFQFEPEPTTLPTAATEATTTATEVGEEATLLTEEVATTEAGAAGGPAGLAVAAVLDVQHDLNYAHSVEVQADAINAWAAQPTIMAVRPTRQGRISKACRECTRDELNRLGHDAEGPFREWVVKQYDGLRLVPKPYSNSGRPDAMPSGEVRPWEFAELKHIGKKGQHDGLVEIRRRWDEGYPGPAALYFWTYDGANFSFSRYMGRIAKDGLIQHP